jgi:hypothetical protein
MIFFVFFFVLIRLLSECSHQDWMVEQARHGFTKDVEEALVCAVR